MQLTLRHETLYRYSTPVYYSIQHLRLTPRTEPHQRVLSWQLDAPGRLQRFVDAWGNIASTLVLSEPHDFVRVTVTGVIEIDALRNGLLPGGNTARTGVSPLAFTIPTPLTAPDDAIRALAARYLSRKPDVADVLELAAAIRGAVRYESGHTQATSTAAHALALGHGVCQDHAHLLIACCRAAGVPARYVSGYVPPGDAPEVSSHAWVDVWIADA